ncbi:MAG TPA: HAD-IC family P-type ATPase, partial [Acidimicrobiales bacterium]|nr:HAD-IC family P-type ATPase [Acidimicrobiales bacterium]
MARADQLPAGDAAGGPPRRNPAAQSRCPWQLESELVAAGLGVDPRTGLTGAEAAARLGAAGPNSLGEADRSSAWAVLAGQFTNAMTVVLAGATAVTVVIGDVKDAVVIAVIVALNGLVGFVQEFRAERAMAALARLAGDRATVRRDGSARDVPTLDIVPGDVVLVGAGDIVPADLRLVEVAALRVNESALTGESEPVAKQTGPLPGLDGVVGERTNMAFRGTAATYGRGVGVAVATGPDTELGQIAALLRSHAEVPTPLQRRLGSLARRLAAAAVVVCGLVFGVGLARGEAVDTMFLTAVSLAVAAIPEGLPAVITVALALGARRMAAHRAIIRKLTAVETLGSVNVICTDKTGTLTENRMAVERVWTPAGDYRVDGR